jgi:hypothetical protein
VLIECHSKGLHLTAASYSLLRRSSNAAPGSREASRPLTRFALLPSDVRDLIWLYYNAPGYGYLLWSLESRFTSRVCSVMNTEMYFLIRYLKI